MTLAAGGSAPACRQPAMREACSRRGGKNVLLLALVFCAPLLSRFAALRPDRLPFGRGSGSGGPNRAPDEGEMK